MSAPGAPERPSRLFVLGGTRSGKSAYALARARDLGAEDVTFVATARPGDLELDQRIALHRRVRPAGWDTLEADGDLAVAIACARPEHVLLVDSLTLWASAAGDAVPSLDGAWDEVAAALARRGRPVVLVSDEVGLGIVPVTPAGRRFRDELGWINQRAAAFADEVVLMVAGLPLRLKG